MRKTTQMKAVEERFDGRDIKEIIIEALDNNETQTEAANSIGVNKATFNHWLMKLGIEMTKTYTIHR